MLKCMDGGEPGNIVFGEWGSGFIWDVDLSGYGFFVFFRLFLCTFLRGGLGRQSWLCESLRGPLR